MLPLQPPVLRGEPPAPGPHSPTVKRLLAVVSPLKTADAASFPADTIYMKNSLNSSVVAVGLPEREVAERLGISEHTVRTQVVRGIAVTRAGQCETALRKDF